MSQLAGAALYSEAPTGGGTPSVAPMGFVEDGAEYVLEETTEPDAELVDWHNDGAEYELLITSEPYIIVDNGGVLELATSGTPAAILIDDDGDLVLSTDVTGLPAGAFYPAANGDIVAARFDHPRTRLVQIGSTTFSYPEM